MSPYVWIWNNQGIVLYYEGKKLLKNIGQIIVNGEWIKQFMISSLITLKMLCMKLMSFLFNECKWGHYNGQPAMD